MRIALKTTEDDQGEEEIALDARETSVDAAMASHGFIRTGRRFHIKRRP